MKRNWMKKVSVCIAIAFMLFFFGSSILIEQAKGMEMKEIKTYCTATVQDDFKSDEILVVLNNQASLIDKIYEPKDFRNIQCLKVDDLTEGVLESILKEKECAGEESEFNRILRLTVEDKGKEGLLKKIKKLEKKSYILSATPNFSSGKACQMPNDERHSNQWAINNILLPPTWDIRTNATGIKVGIIDSGINGEHADLVGNILYDPNGQWHADFTENNSPLSDVDGHGSMIAGIIGAVGNNEIGYAGVCWDVDLVSLRIDTDMDDISSANVIAAISHARNKGIPILNMSLEFPSYELALKAAVEDYPGLIIAAAGNIRPQNGETEIDRDLNNNPDNIRYPACCETDNVITVGASEVQDTVWANSKYGAVSVDLFAPGEGIHSTWCTDSDYSVAAGSSYAAPYVAGVAALIWAQNPNLTVLEVRQAILNNVDLASTFLGKCVTGGKLNAYKALYSVTGGEYHNHTYLYTSVGFSFHRSTCTVCEMSKLEEHIYDGISIDFSTHLMKCKYCNYTNNTPESHTFKYKFGNINNHIKYCTDCDYETTGKHIWIKQDSTTWYCKTCNFKTLLQPISPIMSEPIKQELMLQAALSPTGIVEYNGTTLYFENGDCYLLIAEGADVQAELVKLY